MPEQFYKVTDVAERFEVHPETVKRWVREGRIQVTKLAWNRWRFTEAQIQAFVARNTEPLPKQHRRSA